MEPPPLHYVSFCSFLGLFFLAFVKRRVPKTNRAKEPLKVSEKKISVFLYFPLELFSAILTAPSSFKSGWYFFFCKDKFIYVFMLKEFTQQGVIEVVLTCNEICFLFRTPVLNLFSHCNNCRPSRAMTMRTHVCWMMNGSRQSKTWRTFWGRGEVCFREHFLF